MTEEKIEMQAEQLYYEFSRGRGLLYPWSMLDDNTRNEWRQRVGKI